MDRYRGKKTPRGAGGSRARGEPGRTRDTHGTTGNPFELFQTSSTSRRVCELAVNTRPPTMSSESMVGHAGFRVELEEGRLGKIPEGHIFMRCSDQGSDHIFGVVVEVVGKGV